MKEIAEYILKQSLKRGADDVVVSVSRSNSRHIKFVNNSIAVGKIWDTVSAEIFFVKDKKIAVTSARDCSKASLDRVIKTLVSFSKMLRPDPGYYGIAEGPFRYKEVPECYDRKILTIDDRVVDILESSISSARDQGAKRASGIIEWGASDSYLLTSNNCSCFDRGTAISLSIRALASDKASGHKVTCGRTLSQFKPDKAGAEAGRIARDAKNPKPIPAGTYDIIFDPLSLSNLLNDVTMSASIDSVESGMSFFTNQLGKQVANPLVTLYDDGHISGGMSSGKCDAEGVPTQRTKVIDSGVLRTYLHNTSTSRKYKTKTTANAGIVSPHPTNIVLAPGSSSLDDLISQVKRGILVTNLWYTRFQNFITGDFSTIPRDGIFLIEKGRLVHPVSDIRISDNIIRMLKNVSGLGRDTQQAIGWEVSIPVFTPSVLIRDVNITKSRLKRQATS